VKRHSLAEPEYSLIRWLEHWMLLKAWMTQRSITPSFDRLATLTEAG